MAIYTGTWKDNAGIGFDPASFSLSEQPGTPTGTVQVHGWPDPNCTGTYISTDTHDGWPYYTRQDEAYVIWWDTSTSTWYIATEISESPSDYWASSSWFEYYYSPYGSCFGNPYVLHAPTPAVQIHGPTTPDCTGTYNHAGTHNAYPYWKRADSAYYLYWSTAWYSWMVSPTLNDNPSDAWYSSYSVCSLFWPTGTYSGTALPTYATLPGISVEGSTAPDITGTYEHTGTYNAYPYWTRTDAAFSIWLDTGTWNWHLSTAPGVTDPGYFLGPYGPLNSYYASGTYDGTPNANIFILPLVGGGGIARLRIFGRRAGSGVRPDWYLSGPYWDAGHYRQSPWQLNSRRLWSAMMKFYAAIAPQKPLRVNTEYEQAYVLCIEDPPIVGWFDQVEPPPFMSPWRLAETDWHVYHDSPTDRWYLADTYPDAPGPDDRYYERIDVAWYGLYTGGGTALGDAEVSSATFDGRYFYVGEHNNCPHYYNKYRYAHIWYSATLDTYPLADTFPLDPGETDRWWKPPFPWLIDDYEPQGFAAGIAHVNEP